MSNMIVGFIGFFVFSFLTNRITVYGRKHIYIYIHTEIYLTWMSM